MVNQKVPTWVTSGVPSRRALRRRQVRIAKELDRCSERLPGDIGNDMLRKISQGKRGTSRRSPRRSRTAKASLISRRAMKL